MSTASPASPVVSLAERWTLVYDGDCGFCTRSVSWLARWDRGGRLRFVRSQDAAALAALPPMTQDALAAAMHLVTPGGRVFAGAAAAPHVLRLVPGGTALAALFRVPGVPALADRVYRWVARHRHQLPGATASCDVEAGPGRG